MDGCRLKTRAIYSAIQKMSTSQRQRLVHTGWQDILLLAHIYMFMSVEDSLISKEIFVCMI